LKNSKKREKEVAEKEYVYYPGCSLEGTAIDYEMSVRLVFKALGITLKEPNDWSCCGSTPAHTVDHVFAAALAARNLAIVEKMGASTVITACPACLSAFKKAHLRMAEDETFKKEVNDLLDEPYQCSVTAKSVLQIIYEDIGPEAVAKKVTTALPDLKVAPYYGCIINRPPEVMQFDDPENPIAMDKLLDAVGVEVCDFAFKVECCGAAFGVTKKKMVNKLSSKVLTMALDVGANAISVPCQLCHQNLDLRQDQINSTMGTSFSMPVFYFTQIIGLTYGYSPKELGIDKHNVNAEKVISNRIPIEEYRKQKEEKAKKAKKTKAKKKEA
jgi:heterodisulfide reductase subunit B